MYPAEDRDLKWVTQDCSPCEKPGKFAAEGASGSRIWGAKFEYKMIRN